MSFDLRLARIFARTNGRCALCGGTRGAPLVFQDYDRAHVAGGWEVVHTAAYVPGVTPAIGRGDDLFAAHPACNRNQLGPALPRYPQPQRPRFAPSGPERSKGRYVGD